jgi:quinoprotein glucose dehydrogenase
MTVRCVAAWSDVRPRVDEVCAKRIFEGTMDGRLIAVDAATGKPCIDFGNRGSVDLNALPNRGVGRVNLSSPPAIFEDFVVVGSSIGDNVRTNLPPGYVRAFNARTARSSGRGIRSLRHWLTRRAQAIRGRRYRSIRSADG